MGAGELNCLCLRSPDFFQKLKTCINITIEEVVFNKKHNTQIKSNEESRKKTLRIRSKDKIRKKLLNKNIELDLIISRMKNI